MKKNILWIVGVVIVLIIIVVAISMRQNAPSGNVTSNEPVKKSQEITIGMVTFPGYAPLHIAKSKGYYGNTNVKLVFIESLGELRSAMQSGTIDAYEMIYDMFQSVKDVTPEGVAFLATDESRGADGIVAPNSITKPEDLRGKTVGTEPGFPAYLALLSYLDKGGMTLADVKFKDLPSKDVVAAYLSKSIDVGGTYEPYLSELASKAKDSHILISTKDTSGLAVEFMWVTPKTLADKKDALLDVARGYFKATDLIKTNPDEAFASAAPAFGISKEEMALFKDGIVWPDLAYNQQLLEGKGEKSASVMFPYIGDILRKNNETNITMKADDHITDSILSQIK